MSASTAPGWRRALPVAIVGLLLLGLAFAVQLVAELAAPPGVAGHHDILAFWAAGRLVLDGRPADLYDAAALTAIQRTVIAAPIGMNGYMPYINPPFAAAAFAPLSTLAEPAARIAWAAVSAALAVAAGAWLARDLTGRERLVATLLLCTSYPMIHALAEGQWSILLLAAGLVAVGAARRGAWIVAGVALGAFWLKPQFIALPLLLLVLGRRWRAVAAAVATGAAAVIVTVPLTGIAPNLTYVGYLLDVVASHFSGAGAGVAATWQGDLASTEGINGILVGWFGQSSTGIVNAAWVVVAVALLAATALAMRRTPPDLATPAGRTMIAVAIVVVLLVNPNQFVQDCVLLFLALDVLGPLPADWRLPAIAAAVGLADLTALDLQVPVLHLFGLALLLGVGWVLRRTLAGSPPVAGPVPPARPAAFATGP